MSERRKVVPSNPFDPFERSEIEQTIFQRFEKQVRKYPQRIALQSRSCRLTYDELNRAANRVAHAILERRGEREEQVALFFEHGAATVIALMGAMKAGKCYVVVDPSYPRARIQYILEDSQPSVILTNNRNRALAGELAAGAPLMNLDEPGAGVSDANPGLSVPPTSRHAIYYTSGSAGRPKGVIRTHRSVLHTVMNETNSYHTCAEDRICLTASQSYSAAAADSFAALLNGACLLPFDLKAESLGALAEWLAEQEITIFHPTPTVFRNFAAQLPKGRRFPKVRLVLFAGETICKGDIQQFREHFSEHCLVRAGYSLTEASGATTLILMDARTEIAGNIVPAGYALPDKEVWILDDRGNRLPCSQVGEIAVRSRFLSPGYWRKPELTRAVFLPDPEGGDARVYLTGDLGRMSADGCLEHLGRKDTQVKIRGLKVELTEVEAALLNIPEVQEAAVVAREDARGDQRLAAYVVPRQESSLSVGRLRAALMKSLPAHAVPSTFVFLDALPMTPAGKVDRLALPEPPATRPFLESACIAPRNATEEQLTRIWENVLGVEPIGVQDNFFELGGHSLAAARLFAEIEEAFGKSLPLPLLLQAPTIEQLAAALQREGRDERGSFLIPIQAKGSRPPLFCVDSVNAGIFVHLARRLGPDQPCYGLHPFGLARSDRPRIEIESLAARYLEEMQKVQPSGPYFLCGLCAGGVVAFEMAQQLKVRGQRVSFLALLDPFGPLPPWLRSAVAYAGWEFVTFQLRRGATHVRRLSRLTLAGQAAYLRQGVAKRAPRTEATPRPDKYLRQLEKYSETLLHAVARSARCYNPKPYPGPLVLFLAEGVPSRLRAGRRLAWSELAMEGADVHTVPGMHGEILGEPNVRVLARHFQARLEEAQGLSAGARR